MKIERNYPAVFVTPKGERWARTGHPWIYESDLMEGEASVPAPENGAIVDALTPSGKYIGSGFYNGESKIRIRILSRNANETFDEAFWRRRIAYALDYRLCVMEKDTDAMRLIFGEADGFPGLTADLFHHIVVVQVLSAGIEVRKALIFRLLQEELARRGFAVDGIYERNDVALRDREGLPRYKGWFLREGEMPPDSTVTEISENGIVYQVDFENGQKTGFFLDQKYNRLAVARLAAGKRVLDCFTHTGSFALNAAKGGAAHVTAVDVSAAAIEMARSNAERNQLEDRMDFLVTDVFEYLPRLIAQGGHPYDFIILDPPAFTKSRKTADSAEKGYKEINYRALKLLPRGGYLATASCSHFMPYERFEKMLRSAAADAGVELKQIEMRQQSADHPVLWNVPETDYLKFYLFQIV